MFKGKMEINAEEALKNPNQLNPQIRNLIGVLIYEDSEILIKKRIINGVRVAKKISKSDLERSLELHEEKPFETHKIWNDAIKKILKHEEIKRVERYIDASLDLEIILEKLIFPGKGEIKKGIPSYLMEGYTDMGQEENDVVRNGREKFRVEKSKLKRELILLRREKIIYKKSEKELLEYIAKEVMRIMPYNLEEVNIMARKAQDQTIVLGNKKGQEYGVCRHEAVRAQVYLQVAGIKARLEKGNHYGGRHVWNLLQEGSEERIYDVTKKSTDMKKSPIVEVKERRKGYYYDKTADELNTYKIIHDVKKETIISRDPTTIIPLFLKDL